MAEKDIRELIQDLIHEYMSTLSERGNATDGNNRVSQRDPDGSFNDTGAPYGGAEGQQTRGMEKTQSIGNPNRTRFTRM